MRHIVLDNNETEERKKFSFGQRKKLFFWNNKIIYVNNINIGFFFYKNCVF